MKRKVADRALAGIGPAQGLGGLERVACPVEAGLDLRLQCAPRGIGVIIGLAVIIIDFAIGGVAGGIAQVQLITNGAVPTPRSATTAPAPPPCRSAWRMAARTCPSPARWRS